MRAWLKTSAAALAAAWIATGLLGLAEAVVQRARFGPAVDGDGAGGLAGLLAPATLHGWSGFALAAALLPLAAALTRRASRPRPAAAGVAVAGAVAGVLVVWSGYLLRERLVPAWWALHGAGAGKVLLLLVWVAATVGGARLLRPRLARAAEAPARWLLAPAALAIALTAAYPDWRAEGAARRTGRLSRAGPPAAGAPNLVLVSIDALRRDHLSCVTDRAPPTPALDSLAAEGARFANAWSPSPWTLPGVGALLTGLSPRALDVRRSRPLPGGAATLAEIAWEQGWDTAAFVTNPYLGPWYGFDRGFQAYEHSLLLEPLLPAGRSVLARELTRHADLHYDAEAASVVVPKAIRWLDREPRGRPFFLWLHLLDPHLPYAWQPLPADAPVGARGAPADAAAVPDSGVFRGAHFETVREIRDGLWMPDEAARRAIATLYAREVQVADAWCHRLFTALRRRGLWENTVVIVTADHGEELFDHGGFEHGHSLLPEVTGVPLVARVPGAARVGLVVEAQVSLLDVLPTVCGVLGWPAPPGADGRDVGGLLSGRADTAGVATPLRLENMLYGEPQVGLLVWPWLRIAAGGGAAARWYDLRADPLAFAPLATPPAAAGWLVGAGESVGAAADSLAARVRRAGAAASEADELPAAARRQLRSLGY